MNSLKYKISFLENSLFLDSRSEISTSHPVFGRHWSSTSTWYNDSSIKSLIRKTWQWVTCPWSRFATEIAPRQESENRIIADWSSRIVSPIRRFWFINLCWVSFLLMNPTFNDHNQPGCWYCNLSYCNVISPINPWFQCFLIDGIFKSSNAWYIHSHKVKGSWTFVPSDFCRISRKCALRLKLT